jgi:hypothetical protein
MVPAMQAAMTSTPIQPLIAHAGRSWMTTRVPDRGRLGLAELLDVLAHDSSSWGAVSNVIDAVGVTRQHGCERRHFAH